MKRIIKITLSATLIILNISVIGINSSGKELRATFQNKVAQETLLKAPVQNESGNYIQYSEAKEANPPIISKVKGEGYNAATLITKSDIIVKASIISNKEIAFAEYKNNKLVNMNYRNLYTMKVTRTLKQDITNKNIDIGSTIRVYCESCSHNLIEGSIKLENDKEYILFLAKARDKNEVKYSEHGDYVINASTWSTIRVENKKCYVDKKYANICYTKDAIVRKDGKFQSITFINDDFEDKVCGLIRTTMKVSKSDFNIPLNLESLDIDKIQFIQIISAKYRGVSKYVYLKDGKQKVLTLLKIFKIGDTETKIKPGIYNSIIITYLDGQNVKEEHFAFDGKIMSHSAYDKYNNVVTKGFYHLDRDINDVFETVYYLI